jgi:transcriptional regulator EpsA
MTDFDYNIDDRDLLLEVIHESLQIKNHFELLLWLQGRVQKFIPHDLLISAWGDFSLGLVYFDIVSAHPLLRTTNISQEALSPRIKELFNLWQIRDKRPLVLNTENGIFKSNIQFKDPLQKTNALASNFHEMKAAILHGILDNRGNHDCLYMMMSKTPMPIGATIMIEIFMPFIDCALRRINQLTESNETRPLEETQDVLNEALTSREIEIMEWVKEGKTNTEIGEILDISIFTVKNHLQNIFKKLKALNRSQATFKYKQLY